MPSVLISGAGRGLGLEFARQYAAAGWSVIATLRDPAKGAALSSLGRAVEVHLLDVADRRQIARLAGELKGRAIDLLLCNAGIAGPRGAKFGATDYAAWEDMLRVNVMGPMAMAEAFVDHVAASTRKLIVMISSRMGSIGSNTSGGSFDYRSSKAALNAITKSLAIDLAGSGIAVIAVHPGWVKTDMGGSGATLSADDSVGRLRALIERQGLAESGRFYNYDGAELPW